MKLNKFKLPVLVVASVFMFMCTTVVKSDDRPTVEKNFTLSSAGELEVRTAGGSINVEGVDGKGVVVKAFIKKRGVLISASDDDLEEILEGYEFKIEKEGNKIIALAEKKSSGGFWDGISISFYVSIPHAVECQLHTSGGSIELSSVNGTQSMHTSGGSITMTDIKGNTSAHTSGGSIKAQNLDGDGDLHTSGGSIKILNATGNLVAKTSGGSIKLEDIHGMVDARTSGGGINIQGVANDVKAGTSGGSINVEVTGLNKALWLETSGGSINATIPKGLGLDLDLKGNRVNIDLENFSGAAEKDKISGSMNGGGIPVHMKTSGGSVNVNYL